MSLVALLLSMVTELLGDCIDALHMERTVTIPSVKVCKQESLYCFVAGKMCYNTTQCEITALFSVKSEVYLLMTSILEVKGLG